MKCNRTSDGDGNTHTSHSPPCSTNAAFHSCHIWRLVLGPFKASTHWCTPLVMILPSCGALEIAFTPPYIFVK